MLHKKIQSTVSLIEDVVANRNIEAENANLAKRNTAFFSSLVNLEPTISSYIIAKKSFDFQLSNELSTQIYDLMNYSKTAFENSKAVNPDAFKKNVEDFNGKIASAWVNFYQNKSIAILNDLNIMRPLYPAPVGISNCIQSLKKCEKWPLTQQAADEYIEAEDKTKSLLKEFRFDDNIKTFLKKLSSHAATLNDLTPEILEWIRSENISGSITLGIKIN